MLSPEACGTCATLLPSLIDPSTEKPSSTHRTNCCHRPICSECITTNPRFKTYCPYCQISSAPTALPSGGLRDPPAYSPPASPTTQQRALSEKTTTTSNQPPPAYTPRAVITPFPPSKDGHAASAAPQDVLHFVHPTLDTLASLSLAYAVPIDVLRRKNALYADHLLAARRTVLIPGTHYAGGVSLSPRPIGGEEEEVRKGKVRRMMVGCKVVEYDVALLYLKQADYDLDAAMRAYKEDEVWEKEHPLRKVKGKGKTAAAAQSFGRTTFGGTGGGLTGQLG